MRILIVQPATNPHVWGGDAVFVWEPLWAEYLGAALKPDNDIRLLDLRLEGDLIEAQVAFQPNLIALTAYTVDVNTVKRLCREVKAQNPKVLTIVGGYHANLSPGDLSDPAIDILCIGEGVLTLAEAVRTMEQGRPLTEVPGLALVGADGMRRTAPRPWPHLDTYPFPDRSLTAAIRHHYFDKWMKPIASIRGSYGCPYRCEFCILWPPVDGKYLIRTPESFVRELATIEESHIFFTDDEALIQPDRMLRIARLIEESGIRKNYYFMTRSDSIRKRPDVLEKWASIGLKRVLIGLESHRTEDLGDYNKQATVRDNDEAIVLCHANGVEIQAMFVLSPEYGREDFALLHRYVKERRLETPIYCILTPYPGTVSYGRYQDQIVVKDYDYWDLLHAVIPTRLPIREYYEEYAKLWGDLPPLQRGILRHRNELPPEETLANLRKIRRGFRDAAPERLS